MPSITLALNDKLLARARVKAAQADTTIDSVFSEFLARWVEEGPDDQVAFERLREALDSADYDSGGVQWTREELHER
jgi:hypothetical protein